MMTVDDELADYCSFLEEKLEQYKEALVVARGILSYFKRNVGDTADWPIHVDNQDSFDEFMGMLDRAEWQLKAIES